MLHGRNAGNSIHIGKVRLCKSAEKNCSEAGSYYSCLAYIDDICVDENARGKGVGKAVYEYVRAWAKEEGYYNLTLNVWSCNPGAMKFYLAMGLTPYKTGMETIL